jgi:hypothetical protein
MLRFACEFRNPSDRKLRLFGCACCRGVWHLFDDERSRPAVETAECFADGRASAAEPAAAYSVLDVVKDVGIVPNILPGVDMMEPAAWWAAVAALETVTPDGWPRAPARATEYARRAMLFVAGRKERAQCDLCRDLFNPFRTAGVDPAWRSWNGGAVRHLAEVAYQERHLPGGQLDRARHAVLADAVEEAGYTEAELLGHLRAPGPHVRGCWAVDAILDPEVVVQPEPGPAQEPLPPTAAG